MSNKIEISNIQINGEDKKGNPIFQATGTLNTVAFTALTIQYKGEPIFKLQEVNGHHKMADSTYTRGDRIAVARACKAARLEKFATGAKEKVSPELDTGETIHIPATVNEDANDASSDELAAASNILAKIAELDAEAVAAK
tara:strand:+ start:1026 stop:1448 length:423 start_codon:yes stop_codon:yes gene_type:complete